VGRRGRGAARLTAVAATDARSVAFPTTPRNACGADEGSSAHQTAARTTVRQVHHLRPHGGTVRGRDRGCRQGCRSSPAPNDYLPTRRWTCLERRRSSGAAVRRGRRQLDGMGARRPPDHRLHHRAPGLGEDRRRHLPGGGRRLAVGAGLHGVRSVPSVRWPRPRQTEGAPAPQRRNSPCRSIARPATSR